MGRRPRPRRRTGRARSPARTERARDDRGVPGTARRSAPRWAWSSACSTARSWRSTTTGRPSFERLQQRINVTGERHIARLAKSVPVTYQAFDLLFLEGRSTTSLPYEARRSLLEDLELEGPSWTTPAAHVGAGREMLEFTRQRGHRGRHRQAPRLDVRGGPAHRRVDQGQEHAARPARDRRLHARQGRAQRPHRRRRARRATRTTARCAAPARRARASPSDLIDELEALLQSRETSPFDSGTVPAGNHLRRTGAQRGHRVHGVDGVEDAAPSYVQGPAYGPERTESWHLERSGAGHSPSVSSTSP